MDKSSGTSHSPQNTEGPTCGSKKSDSALMDLAPSDLVLPKCTAHLSGCTVQHANREFLDRK